jgi:hypothetical protein
VVHPGPPWEAGGSRSPTTKENPNEAARCLDDLRGPESGSGWASSGLLARGARFAPNARPAIVNGTAGLIVAGDVRLRAVVGFSVIGGKVTAIDLITDREKLRRLHLS